VQTEIERRKETARNADPRRQRLEELRCEQTRLKKNAERLITAYQENLVSLSQLRERMPELNKKTRAVESELQSLETGAMDQARYLQLSESLDGFRSKLRTRAKTSPGTPAPNHAHPLPSATPSITPQTPSYPLRLGSRSPPLGELGNETR
jgi:DNA repair exonuclease SbcCD ATPase subunit